MAASATITAKGQITLPKEVRDRHGLKPGDRVEFVETGGKTWLFPQTGRAVDLAGMLHKPGMRSVTIDEMDEAIGDFAAEDDARIARGWRESGE
jgi:antitoxin PrlF